VPPNDWTWVIQTGIVAAILGVIVVACVIAWSTVSRQRARRRGEAQRRTAQVQRWANGVHTMQAVSAALMDFEADIESIYFTRPLLGDVNEPATAAFYTAYTDAQALHTEAIPTDDYQITAFVTAAAAAQRAFAVADDNARSKARIGVMNGGRQLAEAEKRRMELARKLLAQALHPSSTTELAGTAHAKALGILDAIGLAVPERLAGRALRSLEALHQPELSVGSSTWVSTGPGAVIAMPSA
jgi:hypothetical protein